MDEQKGKYNRLIVIITYMFLCAWIAWLVATNPTFTWEDAKDFLISGVIPVASYILVKGQNATPVMNIIAKKKTEQTDA